MYKLFIANKNYSSWSLRPWALLRGLGIPFQEELHLFDGTSNYRCYRAFSPTGKVPCLHDGDTAVWDSLAIAEYLAERHPGVWPKDPVARTWARCVAAEMHSGFAALRQRCSDTAQHSTPFKTATAAPSPPPPALRRAELSAPPPTCRPP